MNYAVVFYIVGWILEFESAFLLLPLLVGILYHETAAFSFLIVLLGSFLLGFLLRRVGKKHTEFYAREAFSAVGLSWIVLSVVGALPFVLSGAIPSFVNALFETISGFTTTGATILHEIETLPRCILFWRSFTHWIGGMGVIVFILAVLPLAGGYNMHLMRAESPGPQVGKLVPRVRTTAMTLYVIYIGITVLQVIFLLFGGMPLFDALTTAFGTAGTGGFAVKNDSLAGYSVYLQAVTGIFMIMFGINFNFYYLCLIRRPKDAVRIEEVRVYLGIIAVSTLLITINIRSAFENLFQAFHHAFFQVASIITTTGFSTVDFNLWPEFSKMILVLLMFVGACAGSTGGGMKVSRILIAFKQIKKELTSFIHPRAVRRLRMDDRPVENDVISSAMIFIALYFILFAFSVLVISLDGNDFSTNFTAVAATFNNVGPGLSSVGPIENFDLFSPLSKFVLMFDMLAGRLEILPILVLFTPKTWKK